MAMSLSDEVRRHEAEAAIICPYCGEANRPGAHAIHIGDDWTAVCDTCSKDWPVTRPPRTPVE